MKAHCVPFEKITWLILVREIMALFPENHKKPINAPCGQSSELLNVKAGGTYSYLSPLKG
jgi:hypothetical protein